MGYKAKQKPKKQKPKKKELQQNGSPKQTYSKQNRKNKNKKENELFKDWDKAMDLLQVWIMNNPHSIPGDYDGWVNVIEHQSGIIPKLYPFIKGDEDIAYLANEACHIDFSGLKQAAKKK